MHITLNQSIQPPNLHFNSVQVLLMLLLSTIDLIVENEIVNIEPQDENARFATKAWPLYITSGFHIFVTSSWVKITTCPFCRPTAIWLLDLRYIGHQSMDLIQSDKCPNSFAIIHFDCWFEYLGKNDCLKVVKMASV